VLICDAGQAVENIVLVYSPCRRAGVLHLHNSSRTRANQKKTGAIESFDD
jgi:hypothetical protein